MGWESIPTKCEGTLLLYIAAAYLCGVFVGWITRAALGGGRKEK